MTAQQIGGLFAMAIIPFVFAFLAWTLSKKSG